jgi:ABC-type sugar transport system ATPase subunit
MGADAPVLELRGASKRFGAVQALADVSLTLRAGRVTALCGENGAGKSTLSSIASGLLRPDAGEILVDGIPVTFGSARDAYEAGVRLAPQELVLCPNLSVAENISVGRLPGTAGILDVGRMREIAVERLGRLGHPIPVDAPVADLSVVDQACVQIARAVAPGARVLIVDEPTAPMSDLEAERFLAMLQRLVAGGLAVVYVSHRLDEVFRLADDVVVLRDGRVVADWPRAEVDRGRLVRAMVGDRDLSVARRTGARGEAALKVSGLRYRRVRDVSFTAHEGEILALYGIAGSGREDVGLAVVGAARREAGEVEVRGRAVATFRKAIDAGVGYVPAERRAQGLVLGMSVRENLTLAMLGQLSRAAVVRARDERRTAVEWIQNLSIATPSREQPVGLLSGGSQQKVLLARWLAAGSRVLVLEEPTRGVDVATKAEIYRLLRRLADDGGAILVVSSDVEEVAAVADRTIVLRDGIVTGEFVGADEATIAEAALLDDAHAGGRPLATAAGGAR